MPDSINPATCNLAASSQSEQPDSATSHCALVEDPDDDGDGLSDLAETGKPRTYTFTQGVAIHPITLSGLGRRLQSEDPIEEPAELIAEPTAGGPWTLTTGADSLPLGLVLDAKAGIISGMAADRAEVVDFTAVHVDGETTHFSIQVLLDSNGDGIADEEPTRHPTQGGLWDSDGDGISDGAACPMDVAACVPGMCVG